MFDIEVIDDPQRFTALRAEWNALLEASSSNTLFLTWEWLRTWWSHLAGGRRLFIVTLRKESRLIAIAPLMHGPWPSRTAEFLGTGSVGSDYLDFIVDHAHEGGVIATFADFFTTMGVTLRLPSVKEDSFVARALQSRLIIDGWRLRRVPMQVCPFIDLSTHTWQSYLSSVGANHRYNFGRRLRNLEKSYDVRYERIESDDARRAALDDVITLHLRRWSNRGGSDGFHRDQLISFHEEFSAIAMQCGWLRLRRLTLDGRAAGAFYGFRYRDSFIFYQSGFDETFAKQSVGLVMLGLTIQEAIEEGASEYDMLHGDESYKFLWTTEARPLFRMEFYPPGVAGRMHRDSVVAVATTKRIVKRALNASLNR